MSARPLVQRLVRALGAGRLPDSAPEVVVVSVFHVGDLGKPDRVSLTARQAWWLCVRLGANGVHEDVAAAEQVPLDDARGGGSEPG
jgi:hypothetical protein